MPSGKPLALGSVFAQLIIIVTKIRKFPLMRSLFWAGFILGIIVIAIAWRDTMRDPIVREFEVTLDTMAAGSEPVTIALLADIHVAGPDMPPSRVARIVEQVNALEPDLVLIAGDFVSDKSTATTHYTAEESLAPLQALTPSIASVAVPGNHDHWRDINVINQVLAAANIDVLQNEAAQYGPLIIGGVDDDYTRRSDLPATLMEMDGAATEEPQGGRIILSHSPDIFPDVPDDTGLVLAGHTHCGQIRYPWGGSPATMSRYGQRYSCGIVEENGNILIASSGLGTSILPFRFLAPPEIWLITIGAD